MSNNYPYLEFIRIIRECREILAEDILNESSPSLYDALYSDSESLISQVKLELYELEWIELHWKKINNAIENSIYTLSEKKELISIFAKWYKDFVINWNYTEFDTVICEERISILKNLISVNNEWEKSLKKMEVSFAQSKKVLNEKIKMLKVEVC